MKKNRFSVVIDPRGTRVAMRSKLETQWARFFTLLGLDWSYEPDVAKSYRPDFIVAPIGLVEIKPVRSYAEQHFDRYQRFSATSDLPLFIVCGRPTDEFKSVALTYNGKQPKWLSPFDAAAKFCHGKTWAVMKNLATQAIAGSSEEFISTNDFFTGYQFLNPILQL